MSLHKAIEGIVGRMKQTLEKNGDWWIRESKREAETWILLLETALSASSDNAPQSQVKEATTHRERIEQAKKEMREARERLPNEEGPVIMVPCEGGEADGMIVPLKRDAPNGCNVAVAGWIYVYDAKERKLVIGPIVEKVMRQGRIT